MWNMRYVLVWSCLVLFLGGRCDALRIKRLLKLIITYTITFQIIHQYNLYRVWSAQQPRVLNQSTGWAPITRIFACHTHNTFSRTVAAFSNTPSGHNTYDANSVGQFYHLAKRAAWIRVASERLTNPCQRPTKCESRQRRRPRINIYVFDHYTLHYIIIYWSQHTYFR